MPVAEMREYLSLKYHGVMNGRLVKDMPDRQIIAIYHSLLYRKPKKKKDISKPVKNCTDGYQITMGDLYGIF